MSAQPELAPPRVQPELVKVGPPAEDATTVAVDAPASTAVTVGRRGWLHAVIGLGAAALATGYVLRGLPASTPLTWTAAAVLVTVAVWHLGLLVDARSPLLLADRTGVRVRAGRSWEGLRWTNIESVTVVPRRGIRDGAVSVLPKARVDETNPAPLRVAIGLATASSAELDATLQQLSALSSADLEAAPQLVLAEPPDEEPRPGLIPALRGLRRAARSEIINPASARTPVTGTPALAEPVNVDRYAGLPEAGCLRRSGPGNVSVLVATPAESTEVAVERAETDASPEQLATETDERAGVLAIIGPQLRQARDRLGASVDDVANRTRIRSHVIEALEVDDFAPCGGDFYARGHIRAISRVVGVDAEALVRRYDKHYAVAPISPRTVFQADFAMGSRSAIRASGGGPHWAALIATVLVLTLVWGVARLVFGA